MIKGQCDWSHEPKHLLTQSPGVLATAHSNQLVSGVSHHASQKEEQRGEQDLGARLDASTVAPHCACQVRRYQCRQIVSLV